MLCSCKAPTTENDEPTGKTGGSGNTAEVSAEPIVLEHAYIGTEISLETDSNRYMEVVVANDRLYYMTDVPVVETLKDGTPNEVGYTNKIVSVASDGSDERTIWEKENRYQAYDENGNPIVTEDETDPDHDPDIQEYDGVNAFGVDKDGNVWIFRYKEKYSFTDQNYRESQTFLVKFAPDGTELVSADITEAVNATGYFYPYSMCFNAEGDLCTYSDRTVFVFDGETAEFDFKFEEQGYINTVVSTNTGDVVVLAQPQREMEIKTIDFAAKKPGPAKIYTGNLYFNTATSGIGDYSFFALQNDSIYGVKLETMETEVVVSFTNSDVDGSNISRISSMPNGDFIVSSYNWNGGGSTIMRLTPNPNPIITGKKLITLGAVYLDNTTRAAIRQFNTKSDTARISVIDYSQYDTADNYYGGMTKLDMDILGGRAPDIICFQLLQPEKYASKGILEDMLPYIEGDPDIKREDLFGNILDAGMIDGKLYRLIVSFSISTLVGKTSIVGNPGEFTAARVNEIMAKHPGTELLSMRTADGWLTDCISVSLGDYIDWTTGTCSFNTPEFIELLNSGKHFPKEINYDAMYEDYDNYEKQMAENLRDGKTLLLNSGINRIREIRSTMETFGEEISFVGYPSMNGGGSLIYPNQDYGLSAGSKNKDEAWSFIKMFLTGKVEGDDRGWWQSINRTAFEKNASDEMIPLAERDYSNGVEIMEFFMNGSSSWTVNSVNEINLADYPNYELSQKEVDMARSVIEGASKIYASNETITNIITEELAAFINGAKSAEDVAQVIQSRVSIYVSENM